MVLILSISLVLHDLVVAIDRLLLLLVLVQLLIQVLPMDLLLRPVLVDCHLLGFVVVVFGLVAVDLVVHYPPVIERPVQS